MGESREPGISIQKHYLLPSTNGKLRTTSGLSNWDLFGWGFCSGVCGEQLGDVTH